LLLMCSDKIETKHGFTTRIGGVSTGEWESLNLSSNRGDPQPNVRENYRRVAEYGGVGPDDCAVTAQVHGKEVLVVTKADRHICGTDIPYQCDGLVTAEKGLPIMCFSADCVPVLLSDAVHGVIGAVHCGWRSSVQDILGVAVAKMEALGADRAQLRVAIGPAIGACCFETHGEVPAAVDAWLGGEGKTCYTPIPGSDGKYLVDLRKANRLRLQQLGVPGDSIDVSEECTVCSHDKYCSHRYTKGRRGTQGAIIVL